MVGLEATGLYSLGYQIGQIVNLIGLAFNSAFSPWLFRILNENLESKKMNVVKLSYFFFIFVFIFSITLSIFSPIIISLISANNFSSAYIYVPLISIGYAFNSMYLIVSVYFFYKNKVHLLSLITIFSAILNIILNYLLILNNGSIGAAQSTLIVYIIKFFLTFYFANKIYKMPW
jgi:O-antigen/teichoic acid export membrane protein